jgi:hypothetical protein
MGFKLSLIVDEHLQMPKNEGMGLCIVRTGYSWDRP